MSAPAADRALGASGVLAFTLAALALGRRSWACLLLLAVCVFAGMLTWTVYFDQFDGIVGFVYLGLSFLMIVAVSLALVVSIIEHELRRQSPTR